MIPDPWQARALRSRSDRLLLLLASRQAGKSVVTACIAMHQALFNPETLTLLFAPSFDSPGSCFSRCCKRIGDLGKPVEPVREMSLSLELVNGSRIVTLPGDEATRREDLAASHSASWMKRPGSVMGWSLLSLRCWR